MSLCHVAEILTPKRFCLFGLWYGPHFAEASKDKSKKPKRVFIFVHGLTSSVFGGVARKIMPMLVDKETAVLTFNNRGYGIVNRISGKRSLLAGAAHEVFTDCIDDIRGAVLYAKKSGAKEIYLVGHSTGCQKIVYYAAKTGKKSKVNGLVLLAPVSDYAGAAKRHGKQKLARATQAARALIKKGRSHELLPKELWSEELDDAQRFISLYTPESKEEIFCYAQAGKQPIALRQVRIPILTLWAGKDEYADRPASQIAAWFAAHTHRGKVVVVPNVKHGFKSVKTSVVRTIRQWKESEK